MIPTAKPLSDTHLGDDDLADFLLGRLPSNRLDDVDAHLDRCTRCRAVVEAIATVGGPRAALVSGLESGTAVGRFTVLATLGRGAMGVVYAAYDPRLDRRVAIKMLGSASVALDVSARDRLVREARAMAKLADPNVVAIFEVGEHADETYLAMEFVAGTTLRDWREARSRSWRETLDVFRQAADGLAAAHDAGLVHRDFKPDNVMVGDDGRVRVADFGLAAIPRAAASEVPVDSDPSSHVRTRTGALLGTPAYMAPEQLDGAAADARSDQFAFCVALYESLCGHAPFDRASLPVLRSAIASGAVREPLDARIPRGLVRALRRGLDANPNRRWPSMRALQDAMDAAVRPSRALSLGAVGAVLVVGLGVTAVFVRRGHENPCDSGGASMALRWGAARASVLDRQFVAAAGDDGGDAARRVRLLLDRYANRWIGEQRNACRATFVAHTESVATHDVRMECLGRRLDEMSATIDALAHTDRAGVAAATDAVESLASPALCRDASAANRTTPRPRNGPRRRTVDTLERTLVRLGAQLATGEWQAVLAPARSLTADADAAGWAPLAAEARLLYARVLRRGGRLDDAIAEARTAVVRAETARDERIAALAWLELLAAHGEARRWRDVPPLAEHASGAIERLGSPPNLRASLDHVLGVAATNLGRLDDARRRLESARALRESLGADGVADLARTLSALGSLERAAGHFDAALADHRRARALDAARLGDRHPDLARHDHNIAGALRRLGRLDEARESYERALASEIRAGGEQSPSAALTHNSLGLLALDRGDPERARVEFEAAWSVLGPLDHPERGLLLQNLGVADAAQGRHDAALRRFELALQFERHTSSPEPERIARVLKSMGRSLVALGRMEEAARVLDEAITLAEPLAAASHDVEEIVAEARALRVQASVAPRAPAALPRARRVARPAATRRPPTSPLLPTSRMATGLPPHTPAASPPPVRLPPPTTAASPPRLPLPTTTASPNPRVVPSGSGAYMPAQSWDPH